MSRPSKIAQETAAQSLKKLPKEQREFLEKVRACRKDPVLFAEQLLGVVLHDRQKLWLWMTTSTNQEASFELGVRMKKEDGEMSQLWSTREEFDALVDGHDFLKNILVPSNRWGKTLVTSVKHIWYNFYKKGARGLPKEKADLRCGTLNLSPHSNQCQAGYDYILDILSSKLIYILDGVSHRNHCLIEDFLTKSEKQQRKIHFSNGTSYRAVPTGEDQASSLAGTPYLYISYDECAQSLHLKEELPAKVLSRLIDFGGPLDLVSTPEVDKPSHQYFFHIAKLGLKGEEGWWTLVGKITDNVFLGPVERDRVVESIRTTDPTKYRQVVYGEFVTTGKKMFDALLVERIWDGTKHSQVPMKDRRYLVIADWGFADTGDPTVFYVLDYTQPPGWTGAPYYRIAYRESIQGGSPFAILTRAKMLKREWEDAKFLHDSSAMGGTIMSKMLREMDMHDVIDFSSGGGNKAEMLFYAIVVLSANRQTTVDAENKVTDLNPDFGRLRSYHIPELEEQLGNYQYNPEKGVTDKKLVQDDVMALCMGLWYLEKKIAKTKLRPLAFNPLAPTAGQIFPEKSAAALKMRVVNIAERMV